MLGQPPLASPPPQPASRPAKPTRPFKAYPKDPLSLSLGVTGNADVLLGHDPNQAYAEFRRRMLEQVTCNQSDSNKLSSVSTVSLISRNVRGRELQVQTASGGGSRPPQKRAASPGPQQPSSSDTDKDKDAAYWERRRKNNEAAKRSRDARRAKEDEIAIRAAFLEQENIKLRYEVAALRTEAGKLRCLLYNR